MDVTAVIPLIHRTVRVTGTCRDAIVAEIGERASTEPRLCDHVHQLAAFFSDRTTAVFVLVQQGLLWDAEIVLRSAAEAAMKLAVVCHAPADQRERLMDEYWIGLGEAGALKRSERARIRLASLAPEAPERPIFEALSLPEAEEQAIRIRWPKEVRREMERRWSFTELLAALDSALPRDTGVPGFAVLRHGYGIASHLIHADDAGVGMLFDRNDREPNVRTTMVTAHAARLVSDCLSFWLVVTMAVRAAFKADWPQYMDIIRGASEVFTALKPLDAAFYTALKNSEGGK
jgi:hypothetical protein